jgi:hypothetical protein
MLSPDQLAEYRLKKAAWAEKTAPIREKIAALLQPVKDANSKEYFDKYPPEIQAMLLKPVPQQSPFERQMAWKAKPYLEMPDEDAAKQLKGDKKKAYDALKAELAPFKDLDPGDLPEGVGMKDLGPVAPSTHVLAVGVWERPLQEVQPGFLTLLDPGDAKIVPPAGGQSTGRRTALAQWLTSAENPLTPRVMANRIWHYHFGKGIVGTPSDFGVMGERPSHPELLDWLSREFVGSGWSMKHMHRLIMLSATYQQSSAERKDTAEADPSNRLLWAYPRHRLEAEAVRDASLYAAGVLNLKEGGPSVFPELPAGMGGPRGGWKLSAKDDRNRRSVYIFVKRNARYPMLEVMDMPDTHESCPRRGVTTTAPQALTMLNDKVILEWAQAFAARALEAKDPVDLAFRLAYSRPPDSWEKDTVATFFHKQAGVIAARVAKGEKLALPSAMPEGTDPSMAAAIVDFCHMLISSNEFVYVN